MENKKTKQADLESKRGGFIFLGLLSAGAVVLMAFSLTSVTISPINKIIVVDDAVKEEMKMEFIQNEPVPPKQQPKIVLTIPQEVEIVDDKIIIKPVDFIDLTLLNLGGDFTAKSEEFEKEIVYEVAPVSPKFPGGDSARMNFLLKELDYPEIAALVGEQGVVFVNFVVSKNGSIQNAKIAISVSPALDKEALRVVKSMPNWKPGEKDGKPVNVSQTIPIGFKLGSF